MSRPKYVTRHLWTDLIQIGRANGMSDKKIMKRLISLEKTFREPKPLLILKLLRRRGAIK